LVQRLLLAIQLLAWVLIGQEPNEDMLLGKIVVLVQTVVK